MGLLSGEDRDYLKGMYAGMSNDVNILFFKSENKELCGFCDDIRSILDELSSLSERIKVTEYSFENDKGKVEEFGIEMAPAMVLMGNKDIGIKYYGIPAGYEFSSLVEDINDIGMNLIVLEDEVKETLNKIDKPVHIKVFVTHTCPYCPQAVRTAHKFAMQSSFIKADMVDANTFFDYASSYNVGSVPRVIINEKHHFEGGLPDEEYLKEILNAIM